MPTSLNVLLIEDDPADAAVVLKELQRAGYEPECTRVETSADFVRELGPALDIILAELSLPDFDSIQALDELHARWLDVPLIVVSGTTGEELAVTALQHGAADYLLKDRLHRLGPAVARALEQRRRLEQQRQSEAALKTSEARYRLLFERNLAGVLVTTIDGHILECNDAMGRMLGYAVRGKLPTSVQQFYAAPADRVLFVSRLQAERSLTNYELCFRHRDGRPVWMLANVSLIEEAGQQFILGVILDNTERRRTEQELRLKDHAIHAFNEGLLICDATQPNTPLVYANPGFERMTGYAPTEVLGQSCRLLRGPATDRAVTTEVDEATAAGRALVTEILLYRKDRSPFWARLSLSPVSEETGTATHFVSILTDLSEHKRLEEQYRHAQKMEAVGRLAGGVAHDFNNLLTVINGYSEILLNRSGARDPARDLLGEIKKAGDRAARLTRQLLAFSRQQVLSPRDLDLNAVVLDMDRLLRRLIGEDVELLNELAPNLWHIKADLGHLEQVIVNLAVNARDAIRDVVPTGGRITIRTTNVDLDEQSARKLAEVNSGPYVLLALADTGIGMDEAIRSRIFEPFFTTKGEGGTGLGLSTVYGVVKQSGGHVTVESEPGRGTTFRIYFPRGSTNRTAGRTADAHGELPRGSESILLAEDEPAVLALTSYLLRSCGYTVLEAPTPAAATTLAEKHAGRIDLLVADVVMPHLSGPELAVQVLRSRPNVRVLFLSGYTSDAMIRQGVLQEGVDFLQKPFTAATLARKVRDTLDA